MPPAARPLVWLAPSLAPLLVAAVGLSIACPAAGPHSDAPPRESAATAPAAVAPAPTPAVLEPSPTEPSPTEPSPTEPSPDLPPALAAPGVRPVVQSLWRALAAVSAGDVDAMGRAMVDDGRWYPPGSPEESVGNGPDLHRAMAPWGSQALDVEVRRVIDLGGSPLFAQVSVVDRTQPTMRYELALEVEVSGDRITAVHHFGDPLGPVRIGPGAREPLELGPVAVSLEGGAPNLAHVDATQRLVEALDARKDAAARALLADDVVLHDVIARHTRRAPDGYLAGFAETLGDTGHLRASQSFAGERFVVVVGAIDGRKHSDAGEPMEHGFADIHRLADGKIAETWHYENRRGRPSRPPSTALRLRP